MAAAKDILLDDDWDLSFANGDFLTGLSDTQHQALIVAMDIGHLKESPFLGVGINLELGGAKSTNEIKANIQQNLEADNYAVNNITVRNGEIINIDADRL